MTDLGNNKNDELRNKDKFYFVLSYIPLLQFVLVFNDVDKNNTLKKHITQGVTLFFAYVSIMLIISILGLGFFSQLIGLAYIILSMYLAGKAYNGKYIEIPFIEELSDFFKGFIK